MTSVRRGPRRTVSLQRLGALLLIAFALCALVVEQSQLLHVHRDESPGLYNEQHLLAALLATPSSGVPLADASSLAFLVTLVGLVALLTDVRVGVPVMGHAASRAPPTR